MLRWLREMLAEILASFADCAREHWISNLPER